MSASTMCDASDSYYGLGFVFVLVVFATGCGPDGYEDPDVYKDAVTDPEGPFVQSVTRGGVTVRARYAPPQI